MTLRRTAVVLDGAGGDRADGEDTSFSERGRAMKYVSALADSNTSFHYFDLLPDVQLSEMCLKVCTVSVGCCVAELCVLVELLLPLPEADMVDPVTRTSCPT